MSVYTDSSYNLDISFTDRAYLSTHWKKVGGFYIDGPEHNEKKEGSTGIFGHVRTLRGMTITAPPRDASLSSLFI